MSPVASFFRPDKPRYGRSPLAAEGPASHPACPTRRARSERARGVGLEFPPCKIGGAFRPDAARFPIQRTLAQAKAPKLPAKLFGNQPTLSFWRVKPRASISFSKKAR